jgi:hypothetical protein
VDNARRDAWLSFKDETVRQWREEAYVYGKRELKTQEVRTRFWRLDLTDRRAKRLLDTMFRGEKSGGVRHVQVIMAQRKIYWQNGWIVRIDDGETDESLADLYVTPTLPASKVAGVKGYIDHTCWDYKRSFAVEIECYPNKHWDRLENNYRRNKKMGFPTVFIVPTQADEAKLKEKLFDWKATIVLNAAKFEPDSPEMVAIEVVSMLDNQQNNDTQEPNQSYETKSTAVEEQTFEQPRQQEKPPVTTPIASATISEQEASLEVEAVTQQQSEVEVANLEKEQLLLELASQGWLFRLKDAKGKKYLCARNTGKEHSLGPFNEQTKQIIIKNKIAVQGFN